MRTTLTIDDDVIVQIEALRRERRTSLKSIVNDGLRQGLRMMEKSRPATRHFQTQEVSLGNCLIPAIDNISETLAIAEGDAFR